ncbi:MAG TPA: class E sortase [Solirubrobacteraceae bacterium]|jgi:sortase A
MRSLSTVLILAGVLLIADAVLTVTWQEPVSWLYAQRQQGRLDDQLKALTDDRLPEADKRVLAKLQDDRRRLAFAARSLDRRRPDGTAVGRLRMRRIGLDTVVVQGTDHDALQNGPGHYPDTPLPGASGTVGIAGHRTTYGAPFRNINKLRKGDPIVIEMPYGRFTYEVERTRIVPPTATWVTQRVSYDRLILSACHPLYSAAKRIVVFARLVESAPRGTAARS